MQHLIIKDSDQMQLFIYTMIFQHKNKASEKEPNENTTAAANTLETYSSK